MNAADVLAPLLHSSASAAVLVLLVLVVQVVLHRHLSPQARCALWLLVMIRLIPFSVSSVTSLYNLVPAAWRDPSPGAVILPDAATRGVTPTPLPLSISSGYRPPPALSRDPALTPATGATSVSAADTSAGWERWAVIIWLTGVILLIARVTGTSLLLARRFRSARAVTDPDVIDLLRHCGAEIGVRRLPLVRESSALASPALYGLVRPTLLLPAGFTARFSPAELRFVFLHELAHVRRHDLPLNWIVTALQIAHWFNPLVWYGFARWRIDREVACDAAVLQTAGPASRTAYGQTMLRLLEQLVPPAPRPGLVGILENHRELHRRIAMIAGYRPARRSFVTLATAAALAFAGLTDAQIAPTAKPLPSATLAAVPTHPATLATADSATLQADGPRVLFLVNASETMLGDTAEEIARLRQAAPAERASAAKWQRTVDYLRASIDGLSPDTDFAVMTFNADGVLAIGSRSTRSAVAAVDATLQRLRQHAPGGASDLDRALRAFGEILPGARPGRIVLVTAGPPEPTGEPRPASPAGAPVRTHSLADVFRRLPPRVPVHTVLVPSVPESTDAAGQYWLLAHATGGSLTAPAARTERESLTHLALVVDTSGSMRDPKTGRLWPIVVDTIDAQLAAHPQLTGLQLIDSDGRFLLGRPEGRTGEAGWHPATPETRAAIRAALLNQNKDSVSNPMPGVYNAFRFLTKPGAPDFRVGILVLGDEFNSNDPVDPILQRLDQLNPANPQGGRRVVIDVIAFPTTIRFHGNMGNTGVKFARLMHAVTHAHGGTFVGLPDL